MSQKAAVWFLTLFMSLTVAADARSADVVLAEDSTLGGILDRGRLRVGLEAGYMPFEMIDRRAGLRDRAPRPGNERHSGQQTSLIGFDVDMAREMASALGVRLELVNTRWTSIIPALKVGRFDIIMSGMSITEERARQVDFAAPYLVSGQTVLLNVKHAEQIASYEDLNDPKYVVISKPGTTGESAVRTFLSQATYLPFESEMAGAMEVVKGNADAFVYDLPFNAAFYAMQNSEGMIFLDEPFTTEELAWAIRKNDPHFLSWLNEFLATIKADGRFDRAYRRWFESSDWFKFVAAPDQ